MKFVEEAMRLAGEYRMAEEVPDDGDQTEEVDLDGCEFRLRTHLEAREALVRQMAEALQGMVSGNEFKRLSGDPEPIWTRRVTPLPEALDAAVVALTAYKESQK
jgi:hypothetical protein